MSSTTPSFKSFHSSFSPPSQEKWVDGTSPIGPDSRRSGALKQCCEGSTNSVSFYPAALNARLLSICLDVARKEHVFNSEIKTNQYRCHSVIEPAFLFTLNLKSEYSGPIMKTPVNFFLNPFGPTSIYFKYILFDWQSRNNL